MGRENERFAKLYASFWRHPKIARRSLAAVGLHAKALAYVRGNHTDGVVEDFMIPALAAGENSDHLIDELTTTLEGESHPLWIKMSGGRFQIHDWSRDNKTEAELKSERKADAKRKREARAKKREIGNSRPENVRRTSGGRPADVQAMSTLKTKTKTKTKNSNSSTSSPCQAKPDDSSQVREVFDHWVSKLGKDPQRTKLTADRRRKVQARLRDGYGVERLKRAVDGLASSSFHLGENDQGRRYDDISLVCRNGEKVEQFEAMVDGPKPAGDSWGDNIGKEIWE